MRPEGMGYSAISRVLGVKPETIYSWVKKVIQTMAALKSGARRRRQVGVKVISFEEMWIYVGVRRVASRNSRWIWAVAVEDTSGNRWKDLDVVGQKRSRALALVGASAGA